ncbi:hypothetical protein [Tessaracoccus sp.]
MTRKPFLLLDVDGPLNPWRMSRLTARDNGYVSHQITVTGQMYGVYLNPAHGAALLGLTDLVDLMWATTWEDSANELISPHLGLPSDLPVIYWPADALHPSTHRGSWKTRHVLAAVNGNAFAWFDDDINRHDRTYVAATTGAGPSLLRRVEPHLGLTEADFSAVRDWARAL